ncbi:MAG: MFS transporter [Firmicutes bacterium]|nr:MFS transporter [Bacillota bacterium]
MEEKQNIQAAPLWTRDFILIILANFAIFLGFQMLLPTMPVYVKQLGGQESVVGLVIGIFTVSAVIVRPFVGQMVGTYGRKALLVGGIIIFVISTLAYNWAPTVFILLALRFLHGIGWGANTTAAGTLAADVVPKPRLGEGMGFFGMAPTISMAVAPAVGLFLINTYGFPTLFFTSAALAVLSLIFSLAIKTNLKSEEPQPKARSFNTMFEPRSYRPAVVIFLTTTTYGAIVSFIALFAGQMGIENIGIFFSVYAVVLTLTRPITGMLLDRKGYDIVMIPGLVLVVAGMAILSQAEGLPMFLLVAVVYALGFGAVHPSMQAMTVQDVPPHRRGAANGTFFSAFDLGIGLGSVAWGAVAQFTGYGTMYLFSTIPAVLAFIFYIVSRKK